jgi:hypothetical protein
LRDFFDTLIHALPILMMHVRARDWVDELVDANPVARPLFTVHRERRDGLPVAQ